MNKQADKNPFEIIEDSFARRIFLPHYEQFLEWNFTQPMILVFLRFFL